VSGGDGATPQARKLGLAPGTRCLLDEAPAGWALDRPPDVVMSPAGEPADVVVTFVRDSAELPERVARLAPLVHPNGAIWIAWPRRAAGHRSDITDNLVREAVLPRGLVDVKVAAIDADWSGLKIVWRRENR
jgi:hypothetical protein